VKRGLVLGLVAALVVVGAATGLAASTQRDDENLGKFFFGSQMARAEVVMVVGNQVHDFRIDQGRVQSVRPGELELLERDGTKQVIAISPTARIVYQGLKPAGGIVRGLFAITVREGDQPAHLVRVSGARRTP